MNIGIYIYDNAEVLDFSGPFEVFSTASRICKKNNPFNVFLLSELGGTVTASGGYKVCAEHSFHDHPQIDVLVIAGGDHSVELKKTHVIDWISATGKKAKLVTSVCTGAFLLAEAKLLGTSEVTTHWEDISDLRRDYPELTVLESVRWVDQGKIVTSAGISAGIDMTLHLVAKLHTIELARNTAKQMEFIWTTNQ